MRVSILSFAMIREVLGSKEIYLEVEDETSTVANVLSVLSEKFSGFKELLMVNGEVKSQYLILINEKQVPLDYLDKQILTDGSQLAILPPAGGGC